MNSTWPVFHYVDQPSAVSYEDIDPPFHPDLEKMKPQLFSETKSKFDVTTDDMEIQIFRIIPRFQSLSGLATSIVNFSVTQVDAALPFQEFNPEEEQVVLRCASDGDSDLDADDNEIIDELLEGFHSHTLFLNHRINLNVVQELRPLLQSKEPIPVMVVMTFMAKDIPILRSIYLGNFVQCAEGSYSGRVVMTSAVQCFYMEQWAVPTLETPQDLYKRVALQAALHNEMYEQMDAADEEDEQDSEFDFDEDGHA